MIWSVRAAHQTYEPNQSTWNLEKNTMRKIRNPRYAPEFLERKLSPAGLVYAAAIVQVATITAAVDDPIDPTEGPTDPSDPTTPPSDGGGPTGPDFSS
jgi:hypothetical protein